MKIPELEGLVLDRVGELALRYDDVVQDGRVQVIPLMHATGTMWRRVVSAPASRALTEQGILPILRRLILSAHDDGSFSAGEPAEVRGAAKFLREAGSERVLLSFWLEVWAPHGDAHAGVAGPPARMGRVYAEHVMTRPFAPAGERKVTALPGVELEGELEAAPPLSLTDLADAGEQRFAQMHTDANRHVNSLAYPRVMLERLHAQGLVAPERLARACEVRYRSRSSRATWRA